ncbi:TPA: DUF1542 domain-containing protein [Streptococcus pyogenes]
MLQTVTVTKDQQNPISITLSEDQAKSLKNKEKLKVSIKQKQSKKTSKDFFFEVGIDPKVEAKQKEKLLELDKVKKQIEDSINGDAWLPEKPEGEKPVQNTNKELQLQELNKKYQMAKEAIESATTLDDVETQFDKYTKVGDKDKYPDSLRNQYTQGDKDKEIEKAKKSLGDLSDKVNGKIEEDKWLSAEVKKKQQQELDAGLKAVETTESLDKLKEVESDFLDKEKNPDSIPNQHKAGTPEVARKTFLDNFEKEAKKEIESIKNDVTLTDAEKATAKAKQLKEVETALTKAKDNVKAAKTADAINDARDKGVATIDAVHKAGQDLGARKSGQVAKLEEAAKARTLSQQIRL